VSTVADLVYHSKYPIDDVVTMLDDDDVVDRTIYQMGDAVAADIVVAAVVALPIFVVDSAPYTKSVDNVWRVPIWVQIGTRPEIEKEEDSDCSDRD
jgi:hypothetical protein